MVHSFKQHMEKKNLIKLMLSEGYNPKDYDVDAILAEGFWDSAKKFGKSAALAGALAAGVHGGMAPTPQTQTPQTPQISSQQAIDNHSTENGKLSPQDWKMHAQKYPAKGNGVGFIPDPAKPGHWIPAGGADSVRVQSTTQINNDRLTQDDIGVTPYKDGNAIGPTNVSKYGENIIFTSFKKFRENRDLRRKSK